MEQIHLYVNCHLLSPKMDDPSAIISGLRQFSQRSAFTLEPALLSKAHEAYISNNWDRQLSFTQASKYDQPDKLATDAAGVAKSFSNAQGELSQVDASNPGQNWASRWNQLREVRALSLIGS